MDPSGQYLLAPIELVSLNSLISMKPSGRIPSSFLLLGAGEDLPELSGEEDGSRRIPGSSDIEL